MPGINPGMGAREITDNRKRAAWGHEYNVAPGSAADQAPALDNVLDNVVLSSGRDYAPYWMPPGKIKLSTTWQIYRARGCCIRGAGRTVNNAGPRNHGAFAMSGTDLYWAGAPGATAIEVIETNFADLSNFALYLGESLGANHAGLGILWKQDVTHGHGNNALRFASIVSMNHQGTGMQFGTTALSANVDTFYLERVRFQNLSTGCRWKHDQGLEWTFVCPQFQNCDTWMHFERGGNLWVLGFQAQSSQGNVNIVLVKVDECTPTTGSYHLIGGYFDRQGTNCYVSLFEGSSSCVGARFSARGVNIRSIALGSSTPFDGSSRGFVEAHGGNFYALEECGLTDQPIVRWRTSASRDLRGVVVVRGCVVHNQQRSATTAQPDKKWGTELVTCLEGGYAGQVYFDKCLTRQINPAAQNPAEHRTVTVNVFPVHGSSYSHEDIDNFDSTDPPLQGTWSLAWLAGGATSSPAWWPSLAAYYPFNETAGSISALDRVNSTGLDLAIDADMQVLYPPMPYMDYWCDFSKSDSLHGRNTGVSINTASENLTVFGYIDLQTRTTGRCAWSVDVGGNADYRIAEVTTSLGALGCGRTSFNNFMTVYRIRSPIFVVLTFNASQDRFDAYINGVFIATVFSAQYTATGSGTVNVGGRQAATASVWPGRMSRVGIVKAYITAKEATMLSLAASTCAERRQYYPLFTL